MPRDDTGLGGIDIANKKKEALHCALVNETDLETTMSETRQQLSSIIDYR
jgi:hypothetical protein